MYRKEIKYDRETRDYAMYLDDELVGFARNYHEAEVTLDQLVFELLHGQSFGTHQLTDSAPACSEPDNLCSVHDPCPAHADDAARYLAEQTTSIDAPSCDVCDDLGYFMAYERKKACTYCQAGRVFAAYAAPIDVDFTPIGPEV